MKNNILKDVLIVLIVLGIILKSKIDLLSIFIVLLLAIYAILSIFKNRK